MVVSLHRSMRTAFIVDIGPVGEQNIAIEN